MKRRRCILSPVLSWPAWMTAKAGKVGGFSSYHVDIKHLRNERRKENKSSLRWWTCLMPQGAVFLSHRFLFTGLRARLSFTRRLSRTWSCRLSSTARLRVTNTDECFPVHSMSVPFSLIRLNSHLFFCGNSLFWVRRFLEVLFVLDSWPPLGSWSADLPGFFF